MSGFGLRVLSWLRSSLAAVNAVAPKLAHTVALPKHCRVKLERVLVVGLGLGSTVSWRRPPP